MALRLLSATFAAADPARLARFWAAVLTREIWPGAGGMLVPGGDTQLSLRFVRSGADKAGPNRMHVHLTSASLEEQQRTVELALSLGAYHLDVGQRPEEEHVVLADPEANEFCVIEPGNSFLSGCGFLGELACEGTRAVGVFWSAALEWPLVWDQDEETAIQAPLGGTKIAWGGPPVAPREATQRQRFDVEVIGGQAAAEVDRLVALGAGRLGAREDGSVALTDPDGVEFRIQSL